MPKNEGMTLKEATALLGQELPASADPTNPNDPIVAMFFSMATQRREDLRALAEAQASASASVEKPLYRLEFNSTNGMVEVYNGSNYRPTIMYLPVLATLVANEEAIIKFLCEFGPRIKGSGNGVVGDFWAKYGKAIREGDYGRMPKLPAHFWERTTKNGDNAGKKIY